MTFSFNVWDKQSMVDDQTPVQEICFFAGVEKGGVSAIYYKKSRVEKIKGRIAPIYF
jgi:hypothetical protein